MNTDQTQTTEDTEEDQQPLQVDELAMLKQRARLMGISFSNNIGTDALRAKITAKMEGRPDPDSPQAAVTAQETEQPTVTAPPELTDPADPAPAKKLTLRQKLVKENMKLIRLRIINLDPKKKDLPGEIFTVANEHLGTVRKFIPYGERTDEGFHVPFCLYKMMKARKFLNIRTYKDRQNQNQIKIEQNWANEFALEVLPPLTREELARLGTAQQAAGGLS